MQCVQVLMGKHEQISNKLRKQTIGIPSVKQACHTNYSLQIHISIIVVENFGGWHFLKSFWSIEKTYDNSQNLLIIQGI